MQAHIDNFWRLAEKEAHSIMFQSSEADLGQLQEDMEATDRRDAAQNILHNQEFLHASKEVCSAIHLTSPSLNSLSGCANVSRSSCEDLDHKYLLQRALHPWKQTGMDPGNTSTLFCRVSIFREYLFSILRLMILHGFEQFCLVLKQYAATGIRQRQDNISSDNLALRSIYNPSVKSVTFLSSQKEAGPLFDQYRQSLPAEIGEL